MQRAARVFWVLMISSWAVYGSGTSTQPDPKPSQFQAGVLFIGDDCSVYTRKRADAWGVCFRVNESRAYTEFDLPCPSKIGRKLFALRPAKAGAQPELLFDAGKGCLGSPSVSFDGTFIYLSMALEGDHFFHIYRIPASGGLPKRLTDGPFHDLDPAELPDGRIVFASTRIGTYEEYHSPPSRALFAMNADGTGIRPITFTPIWDNEPKVTADGRIAFIRTDNFFDRAKVETQIHVIRPDGCSGVTEIGAEVGPDYGVRLRTFGYGSPAPLPDGRLACISSRGNFVCEPGSEERAFRVLPADLGDLSPLPDGRLLCTILKKRDKHKISDGIGILDPATNRIEQIFESPGVSVHSVVYLGARPRPPVLARTVSDLQDDAPNPTGFLFCQDVRLTRNTKAGWPHVRAIRVLGGIALTNRSSHSHIVHAGIETVELGTVPLAPDGSFFIEVPANLPIALQAIDAEGRSELNEMSWQYVRPGERRSCVGCHQSRQVTPASANPQALALQSTPLQVLGQGQPHRFRGNNAAVNGLMDLQFERFRETASLNLHDASSTTETGAQEVAGLCKVFGESSSVSRISAAQRLALFRDRSAVPALAVGLRDAQREVRAACALALSSCGTRESAAVLIDTLEDADPWVAQAAWMALENITGRIAPSRAFDSMENRKLESAAWRTWLERTGWDSIEQELIKNIANSDSILKRQAIIALGHVGGSAACSALRQFVTSEKERKIYTNWSGKDERIDKFTFSSESPLNPRTLQAAVRALGHLKDSQSIPLLTDCLMSNLEPKTGNLYLAEAATEALGRISTPDAERALVDAFSRLGEYYHYVGWYGDHSALWPCHSSPLHYRITEALDALCTAHASGIAPNLIRSVPTDPDRALMLANDDCEVLVGRVIRRCGVGDKVTETCLAMLGETQFAASPEFKAAISSCGKAWAGTPDPETRAAQILSLVCRDRKYELQIRAAFQRYVRSPAPEIRRPLDNPKDFPKRNWVLFFLGRSLGNLGDQQSVDSLVDVLENQPSEASFGRPDPSEPNIHFLQLQYTPCWRAAAAWALGSIGDRRAVSALLKVVGNLDNATDVRHAAAMALGRIADPYSAAAIRKLARDYPEVSTRLALLRACAGIDAGAR